MENIEPVNGKVVGYPTPTVGGPGAPSCYRVSLLSGSLEVTARLKSVDDLELLVKVLEANKPLFAKVDRLATQVLTLTQEFRREFTTAVPSPVRSRSAGLVASVATCGAKPSPLATRTWERRPKLAPASDRIPGPAPSDDFMHAPKWKRGANTGIRYSAPNLNAKNPRFG